MIWGAHQASNLSSNMIFSVLLGCGNNNIDNSIHGTVSKLYHLILSFMLNLFKQLIKIWMDHT